MVEPNKYLKIWPQVVKNCISYLKPIAKQGEYQFAFPSAFLTILYLEDEHYTFTKISEKVLDSFIFLRKLKRSKEVKQTKITKNSKHRFIVQHHGT